MSDFQMGKREKMNDFGIDKRRIFSMPIHMVEPIVAANQDNDVPFLASFLKLCSSLFILPFYVEFNKTEGTWNSQKSTKRIVTSLVIIWIPIVFIEILTNIHAVIYYSENHEKSAKYIFLWVYSVLTTVRYLSFFWTVNVRSQEITNIMNIFTTNKENMRCAAMEIVGYRISLKSVSQINKTAQRYYYFIVIVYSTIAATLCLFASDSGSQLESPDQAFRHRINATKTKLFISTTVDSTQPLSVGDTFLGIFFTWFYIAVETTAGFTEICLVGQYPIMMWLAVKHFELFVSQVTEQMKSEDGKKYLKIIIEQYEKVKAFSGQLNDLWAKPFFVLMAEISLRSVFVFEYNKQFDWTGKDFCLLIFLAGTIFASFVAIKLGADVYTKMRNFKQWIKQQEIWESIYTSENKKEIKRLLADLDDEPIGIGNGVFQFTYGFIAQVLALMITVFVVSFEK